jgi:hypothetical protein
MVRRLVLVFALIGALASPVPSYAAASQRKSETNPPKGATAQCKDRTYSMAQSRQGACSRHGGVATWLADTQRETKAAEERTKTETKDDTKAPKKSAAGARLNATALCKDGTYSFSAHRSGTCSHHGGVKTWLNPPTN